MCNIYTYILSLAQETKIYLHIVRYKDYFSVIYLVKNKYSCCSCLVLSSKSCVLTYVMYECIHDNMFI